MRPALLALAVALLCAAPTRAEDAAPPGWDGASLVAHEWGTFTSVQGSDGVALGCLSHEAALGATTRELARGTAAQRAAARKRLEAWGRFAIPYLVRARSVTDDPAVLAEVDARLAALEVRR